MWTRETRFFFIAFCVLLLLLLLLPAKVHAQSYLITEEELQQLETLYHSSEVGKQKAQEQLKKLQPEAKKLQAESMRLSELLKAERESVKTLTQSVSELEKELASERKKIAAELAKKQDAIDALKNAKHRLTIAVVVLGAVLALIIAGRIVWAIIKVKTSFLRR